MSRFSMCWLHVRLTGLLAVAMMGISTVALHAADQPVSVPLFDGKTLTGWEQHGGKATYTIEDGEIVGTSVLDTGNSFLCTDRPYENFILNVDVKVDSLLNSGIQIRSNVYTEPKAYHTKNEKGEEKVITVPAGRVHGYQVEIDPSSRAWSGGIYDEGRRGWLNNLVGDHNAAARAAFKPGEWNHYRIEANGTSIKTWINDVPVSDIADSMTSSGFIALQVHGIGKSEEKNGKQVRWKNISIQELPVKSLTYPGKAGPGVGKKIVFLSGDEEYRSEEALPQLAKILSERHGFDCTVLFSVDPQTGFVNPNVMNNIPGIENLDDADLMVIFTRFRQLPDEQMQHVDAYLKSGKPVLGLRTSTHAFNPPKDSPWGHYANGYKGERESWTDGFGRLVLGERWHTHHGSHKNQSTRGVIAPGKETHPILRGVKSGEIWGSTDVYGVRLPLPGDAEPLVLGQVINRPGKIDETDVFYGMRPTDNEPDPKLNEPMMPIVWVKSYQVPEGQPGKSMTSTIGAAVDLTNQAVRRELVNGVYFLTGLTDQIPATGTDVELVGDYKPSAYGFRSKDVWTAAGKSVSDFK